MNTHTPHWMRLRDALGARLHVKNDFTSSVSFHLCPLPVCCWCGAGRQNIRHCAEAGTLPVHFITLPSDLWTHGTVQLQKAEKQLNKRPTVNYWVQHFMEIFFLGLSLSFPECCAGNSSHMLQQCRAFQALCWSIRFQDYIPSKTLVNKFSIDFANAVKNCQKMFPNFHIHRFISVPILYQRNKNLCSRDVETRWD